MTSTTYRLPQPIELQRPLWRRLLDRLKSVAHRDELSSADLATLAKLPEATLRDIGAPHWLHEVDRERRLADLERMRW